jgi:predicted DNA-binding transcriptional regulator YafY
VPQVTTTLLRVRQAARQLTVAEVRILAHAIDNGMAVTIDYESQTGALTRRVIEDAALSGGTLTAWCRMRQDERHFTASRLRGVAAGAAV